MICIFYIGRNLFYQGLEMVINESWNFWCDTQLNLLLAFQDYLVYGFSVKCKILVSLGYLLLDHLQFLEEVISRFWTFLLFGWPFCYVVMLGLELIVSSWLCQIIADWLLWCSYPCPLWPLPHLYQDWFLSGLSFLLALPLQYVLYMSSWTLAFLLVSSVQWYHFP